MGEVELDIVGAHAELVEGLPEQLLGECSGERGIVRGHRRTVAPRVSGVPERAT